MARPTTRTIRLRIFVHASPRKVFHAITQPKMLTRWFMDRATLTPSVGGRYSFT